MVAVFSLMSGTWQAATFARLLIPVFSLCISCYEDAAVKFPGYSSSQNNSESRNLLKQMLTPAETPGFGFQIR